MTTPLVSNMDAVLTPWINAPIDDKNGWSVQSTTANAYSVFSSLSPLPEAWKLNTKQNNVGSLTIACGESGLMSVPSHIGIITSLSASLDGFPPTGIAIYGKRKNGIFQKIGQTPVLKWDMSRDACEVQGKKSMKDYHYVTQRIPLNIRRNFNYVQFRLDVSCESDNCRIHLLRLFHGPPPEIDSKDSAIDNKDSTIDSKDSAIDSKDSGACGGVTLFNADTAKDIAAQKGIIDSVTKYMEKSMCTTDLTIIAKAKTEAYAEADAKIAGEFGVGGVKTEAAVSAKASAYAEIDSKFSNKSAGCEAISMMIRAAATAKKQATCVINRITQTSTATMKVVVTMKQVNTGTVHGNLSQLGVINLTLNADATIKSQVTQELNSIMETMLSTVAEQSTRANKGALVGQTSVKLSNNETSSVNSASLKQLVNDATNSVISELYLNTLLEQVNAGVVYGDQTQVAQISCTLIASLLTERVISQTLTSKDMVAILSTIKQKSESDSRGLDTITGQAADVAKKAIAMVGDVTMYIAIGGCVLLLLLGMFLIQSGGGIGGLVTGAVAQKFRWLVAILSVLCLVTGIVLFVLGNTLPAIVTLCIGALLMFLGIYLFQKSKSTKIADNTKSPNTPTALNEMKMSEIKTNKDKESHPVPPRPFTINATPSEFKRM